MNALFDQRDWADFREFDSVVVGVVAHYAFVAHGKQTVWYICKMACRKFAVSGMRNEISLEFSSTTDSRRRELLIAFLRDVWIEENLSLNHFLESTDDVRRDRMQVLQVLLQWDEANRAAYVEEIKDLTFDETLRQGLRSIDQTRVFVNESAITRWAEKELLQDYERWRLLSEATSSSCLVDDILRQYVVDPSNHELLKEFGSGKPSEADALLINLLERLYKRFLLDPTDGLDCYLSLRIRHGSLRGTLFGPLEEQGLLYCSTGFSREAFKSRWGHVLELYTHETAEVLVHLERSRQG